MQQSRKSSKTAVEADRDAVSRELSNALRAELTENQKDRIQEKADSIQSQYESWLGSLSILTSNMDSYVTASANNLSGFRTFISAVLSEGGGSQVRSKRVKIIDYLPAVNRKIKMASDIDDVLDIIREKIIADLEDNDEIDLI